jgi:hypothetical protein
MTRPEQASFSADLDIEQTRIAAMTFWLCLRHAIVDMVKTNGAQHALDFQRAIILGVKNGDISMPIDKETETFKFVISLLEELITIKGDDETRNGHSK